MAIYKYEALTRTGENVVAKLSANSDLHATEKIRKMGYSIVYVKESKYDGIERFIHSEKPVKVGDLSLFSRQMSSMIGAGIPVTRAISIIAIQTKNVSLKKSLETIASNVESGMALTDAFGGFPHIFNDLFISLIESGELGGMLEEAFDRIADQMYKDKKIKDAVTSSTFYPKIVLAFAGIVTLAMLIFLIPMFQGMTEGVEDLPFITKIMYVLSSSIRGYWYYWIVGLIVFVILMSLIINSKTGKMVWDKYKIKVPLIGPIFYLTLVARFSRTLSTLLGGGIPVIQALKSSGDTAGSDDIAMKIRGASENIEQGNKIADELENLKVFPATVIHMVNIGEETGQLPELLGKIAEFYEDEVETKTRSLSAILEPLMLIVVGLVVGGMLIALYLPMFTAVTSFTG